MHVPADSSSGRVQMYSVNPGGRGVQQLAASVELEGAQPVKLHGGNLLAVGTSQQLKSGVHAWMRHILASALSARLDRFYDDARSRAMRFVPRHSHRMVSATPSIPIDPTTDPCHSAGQQRGQAMSLSSW